MCFDFWTFSPAEFLDCRWKEPRNLLERDWVALIRFTTYTFKLGSPWSPLRMTTSSCSISNKVQCALCWKTAVLPSEATKAAVATDASSWGIWIFPGTPLRESWRESLSAILKPIENLKGLESRTRQEIKRARDGSNKEETFVGVSGWWLLLIRRCSASLSFQSSQTKANDFAMGVANKKQRLHSSRQLPWSSRMGWQVVSTTIFDDSWIFDQMGNEDGNKLSCCYSG